MTDRSEKDIEDELQNAVQKRHAREEFWRRTGERPLWRNLSMVGALGWLIVTPTLFGAALGHWLDTHFGTGIMWSGALIILGTVLGGYLAWQRIDNE